MKNIFLFFYLSMGYLSFAQMGPTYNVVYQLDYKKYSDQVESSRDYFDLVGNKSSSVFDNQSNFKRDSLFSAVNDLGSVKRKSLYYPNFFFSVIKKNDSIIYQDKISMESYKFKMNKLNDWEFVNDTTMVISGYNCNLATIDYGGRKWNAWYTLQVPIQNGPYVFSGLPGLIIKITDLDNSFSFKAHSLTLNSVKDLNFRMSKEKSTYIDREKFIALRMEVYSSYQSMNNASGVVISGDDPITKRKITERLKKQIFIEMD